MKSLTPSLITITLLAALTLQAQKTTISGTVRNSINDERIAAVSISTSDNAFGTFTNDKGNFLLTLPGTFPIFLTVSSIGFESQTIRLSAPAMSLDIQLQPVFMLEKGFTFAATKSPIKYLESPVTVEQMNAIDVRNSATPGFYEGITNLKGVDLTTSGFNFRTVSTRGFNGSGNLRMNQFMDGMDNQAPGLNFTVGNLLGMTELDVDKIELLPGASSALYGSGGINGTLLMTSKNPFKTPGFSFQVKEGIMHLNDKNESASPYHDFDFRWARAYNRFAYKINLQITQARDWQAQDESNLARTNVISKQIPGDRNSDPNYDGVNSYGDEINADMFATTNLILAQVVDAYKAQYLKAAGRNATDAQVNTYMSSQATYGAMWSAKSRNEIPKGRISRTGYEEKYLTDYNTYNAKVSAGLYYNITKDIEASLLGYWGTGTTVYTGADRYSLKKVKMGQYKAEIKHKNWNILGYTTQENAGEAYNTVALASFLNESWKPSQQWFPQYVTTYFDAVKQGSTPGDAHLLAREKADQGRLIPGTAAFDSAVSKIRQTPISKGGALFVDKTDLWQFDGQLNLTEKIKVMEVLVGADYRQYVLNSAGTIFSDTSERINIPEWGAFIQLQKSLLDDNLKITASARYDKSKNFKGQFTPRITGLMKVGENKHIRLSYQSAYRFPSVQDQYNNLFTGTTTLIGALPQFQKAYGLDTSAGFTSQSIAKYRQSGEATDLQPAQFNRLKPETVRSTELGYKAVFGKKLLIDIYGYLSTYNNFIGRMAVGQPNSSAKFKDDLKSSVSTKNFAYTQNVEQKVKASGFGFGIEYKLLKSYIAKLNASSDKIYDVPEQYITLFNAPLYRFNIGLSNNNAWKQFGFNINYRWQDKVNWEGTFASGIIPAFGTLDGQINYKPAGTRNMIKLGASNLLNRYYYSAFGNPQIGGLYYLSYGFNIL